MSGGFNAFPIPRVSGVAFLQESRTIRDQVAGDRVQTGLDAAQTAADRVQTGLDRTVTEAARDAALSAYQGRQYAARAAFVADTAYVNGADAPANGTVVTAGGLQYVRSAGAAVLPGLPGWLPFDDAYADHFEENVIPGTTDMADALQAALDYNQVCHLLPVAYRSTQTLIVAPTRNRSNGFICKQLPTRYPTTVQPGGPTKWSDAVIRYDGDAGATACVIAASAEAVGIEPVNSFANTIWGFTLKGVTIDGNDKAAFGFYGTRVQQLDFVSANFTRCNTAGWSINGTYSGRTMNCKLFRNRGRGGEEGYADVRYGWTLQDKTNALIHYNLHADANGHAAEFRQSDPVLRTFGCGYYFGPHRGGAIYGITSENNYGANIVLSPSSSGNLISGVYTELGCRLNASTEGTDAITQGHADRQIGILVVGTAAMQNCRVADGVLASDHIILTGVGPTASRRESAFEVANIALCPGIDAGWANYRLINCGSEMGITGSQPAGAATIQGGVQFRPGGPVLTYDEGTFIPSLVGSTIAGAQTYSVRLGRWTRIGNRVFFNLTIVLSATDGAATGVVRITGLPFPALNAGNIFYGSGAPRWLNVTSPFSGGQIEHGTAYITMYRDAGGSALTVNATEITATTRVYLDGNYEVAA